MSVTQILEKTAHCTPIKQIKSSNYDHRYFITKYKLAILTVYAMEV